MDSGQQQREMCRTPQNLPTRDAESVSIKLQASNVSSTVASKVLLHFQKHARHLQAGQMLLAITAGTTSALKSSFARAGAELCLLLWKRLTECLHPTLWGAKHFESAQEIGQCLLLTCFVDQH